MPKKVSDSLRILALIALAFCLAYFLPLFGPVGIETLPFQITLFAFLLGFFINRALTRKQTLATSVAMELTRLRRLHHISQGLGDKTFTKKLMALIKEYHEELAAGFPHHAETSSSFRHITKLIYRFRPKDPKDEPVYTDMLTTARNLALERNTIEGSIRSPLGMYSWTVILILAFFVIVILLAGRTAAHVSPFAAGATISAVLVAVDLLMTTDRLSKREIEKYKRLYRENFEKAITF